MRAHRCLALQVGLALMLGARLRSAALSFSAVSLGGLTVDGPQVLEAGADAAYSSAVGAASNGLVGGYQMILPQYNPLPTSWIGTGWAYGTNSEIPVRWTALGLVELARPAGVAYAEGRSINNAGVVVGFGGLTTGPAVAIKWSPEGTPRAARSLPPRPAIRATTRRPT